MQSSGLTYEDIAFLATSSDDDVVSICQGLSSLEIQELINFDQRYARLCGNLRMYKRKEEQRKARSPRFNTSVSGISGEAEDFGLADLDTLRQTILDEEAGLAPGQYLNITNAHLAMTRNGFDLAGIRRTTRAPGPGALAQSLPGHPQLLASGDAYNTLSEVLNMPINANARRVVKTTTVTRRPVVRATRYPRRVAIAESTNIGDFGSNGIQSNGRKPQHAFRPNGCGQSTYANGRNQNINDFSDEEVFFDEEGLLRDAIFGRMDTLQRGRSLDISNTRVTKQGQVVGLRTITTPEIGHLGGLRNIPGYPRLLVRPNSYNYYSSLLGAELNQSNASVKSVQSNGCGCGK